MSEVSSIGQGHWGTPLQEGLKKHWVDIALIVSTVASAALVFLIHYGMIHPTFHLPYFGTISETFIKHIFEFGTGFVGTIALGKWIYQICQSIKTDTSSHSYPSPSSFEEESEAETESDFSMSEFDRFLATSEKSEAEEPGPIPPPIVQKIYRDSEVSWWDSGETSAHPSRYSFTLNGKLATLYGIYDSPIDSISPIEKGIAQELKKATNNDPQSMEQKLNQILTGKNHHIVLKIEDQLVVSGNYCLITDKTISKQENLLSTRVQIKKGSKTFLVLGDPDTLTKISTRDISSAYMDCQFNKDHLARRIYNRLASLRDIEGISLMVLGF